MRLMAKPKLVVLALSALIVAYGLLGGLMERVSARDEAYRPLGIFVDVLERIRSDYVEVPQMREAVNGAIQGMMEALDPYSSFVEAATYRELSQQAERAASPGLVLSRRYGYLYVSAVRPESAAAQVGLRSGDLVESIEGKPGSKLSLWEAEAMLRGEPGSKVSIDIVRPRRPDPVQVKLEREDWIPAPPSAKMVESGIGLLRIPDFLEGSAEAVTAKLKMLSSTGATALLIDLRGSARGSFDEAVRAADQLLPVGKPIVSISRRGEPSVERLSLSEPVSQPRSLVLLVDSSTGGPAEVFGAALREHLGASIVGERTIGYASDQEPFQLSDGSVLWLTTRFYNPPGGDPIQAESLRESGLKPGVRAPSPDYVTNFFFEFSPEESDESQVEDFYRRLGKAIQEEQLKAGLELLREALTRKAA